MTDIFSQLNDEPEEREVTVNGKTGTAYFRRLTGAQKEHILKGMRIVQTLGKDGTVDIDLGQNEHQRHLWVLYCVCDASGTRRYKKIEDVKALDSRLIDALYKVAEEVNKTEEEEDPGKS